MFKHIIGLMLLVSCVASAEENYVKFEAIQTYEEGDRVLTEHDYGSGVRWNNDYVVTAKHVGFAQNSVYKCSENCDLQFVKRKVVGNGVVPEWRESVATEKVTIIGNSIGGKTVVSKGRDINRYFYVASGKIESRPEKANQKNAIVYASTAEIVDGQSGGPVFSDDGKVVGMLIGKTILTGKGGEKYTVSVYVPYSVIKAEWEKYKKES